MHSAHFLKPWTKVSTPSFEKVPPFACVILAGGQATRLGLHGPKAFFCPYPDKKLCMLELLLKQIPDDVPLAIMIDPFAKNLWDEFMQRHKDLCQRVALFTQTTLPLLTEQKMPLTDPAGELVYAPDGNGSVFACLQSSGILKAWQGFDHVVIASIDNLLGPKSFSPLAAFASCSDSDWTVLAMKRENETKAGVLVEVEGKLSIKDYMEIASFHEYPYINAGIYCLKRDIIEKLASFDLPVHLAKKEYPCKVTGKKTVVYKQEKFLFDLLPYASKASALCMEEKEVFYPIKEARDALLLSNGLKEP